MFSTNNLHDGSLNKLCSHIGQTSGVTIKKQGLDSRFNETAVRYSKAILEKSLKKHSFIKKEWKKQYGFNRILIQDSTSFQLPSNMKEIYPGPTGAGARIQLEIDLLTCDLSECSLHSFNYQDSKFVKEQMKEEGRIQENDLFLRDLAYSTIDALITISENKAWFISKYKTQTNIFKENSEGLIESLDLSKLEPYMRKHKISTLDYQVYISRKMLPVRMIIQLLPEDVKAEKIRKAKKYSKKKGSQFTKTRKAELGLHIILTNLSKDKMQPKDVADLYRIRWQIELIFKVWKTGANINKVRKMKVIRWVCMMYIKLAYLVLNWKILMSLIRYYEYNEKIYLSVQKVYFHLVEHITWLRLSLSLGIEKVIEFLKDLFEIAPKQLVLEKKKDKIGLKYCLQVLNGDLSKK